MKKLKIYTDGGCRPNPGPGGWAFVILRPGEPPEESSGFEAEATNNRMELRAALEALNAVGEGAEIELYTDSEYLRKGIESWMPAWKKRAWRTASGSAVKNDDLWKSLDTAIRRHQVSWHWVKGHSGDRWNERVDELASSAIPRHEGLIEDENAIHVILGIAYSGKSKNGAWAALLRYREHERDISGVEEKTSPNRLHILGAVQALKAMKRPLPVHVYTASDYLKEGATTWVKGWKARGWKTRDGKQVSHRELWQSLDGLCSKMKIQWHVLKSEEKLEELEGIKRLAKAVLSDSS